MKALAAAIVMLVAVGAAAQDGCPKPTGRDFSGMTVSSRSFAMQDLRGANFTNAKIREVQFTGTDLTGAVFAGATFESSKDPRFPRTTFQGAILTRACFQGARFLIPMDMQFANLACADFSSTDVRILNFGPRQKFDPGAEQCGRAKFIETIVSTRTFAFSVWRSIDFTRTKFTDLTPEQISFKGTDITGALLAEANLAGFDFTGATLTDADLSRANLLGARLDEVNAKGLILDDANFRFGFAIKADMPSAKMRKLDAQDAQLPGAVLVSADLREAKFASADLAGADLSSATLQGGEGLGPTELSGANLNGATFEEANLNFVGFQNTRLINAKFKRVTISDTDFSGVRMPGADFSQATLEGVTFRGASLENASFARAAFGLSKLSNRGVDLACTQLGGVDLRLREPLRERTVTFLGAVLLDGSMCRQMPDSVFCGREPAGQQIYGPTLLPELAEPVTCPDGRVLKCEGPTWALPEWKTTACGSPETRWVPPPRDPVPPDETVDIPDKNFRICLSRQFFGVDDHEITIEFARSVQEITCTGKGIAYATGLEAFTNLRKLTLLANELTNGEIFGKLPKLEVLQVSANKLTELDLGVATLKAVFASNNAIRRVDGLGTADLVYLDLSHNQLETFPLASQRRTLVYADLSHNRLTEVGNLSAGFTELADLYLQNNDLVTIGSLQEAASLANLRLGSNPRFRCETLKVKQEVLERSNCGK